MRVNKTKFKIIMLLIIIMVIIPPSIIIATGMNYKVLVKNTEKRIHNINAKEFEEKLIKELEKSSFNINDEDITTTFEVCNDSIEGRAGELNVRYGLENIGSNKKVENPYKGYILACIVSKNGPSYAVYIPMFKIESDSNGKVKNIHYLSSGKSYCEGTITFVNNILIEQYGMKSNYSLDQDSFYYEEYYYFPFSGGGRQSFYNDMKIYYSNKEFGTKVISKLCKKNKVDDTLASKWLEDKIQMTSWRY